MRTGAILRIYEMVQTAGAWEEEIWWRRIGKEDKNCCMYVQQLKLLHKHDPLSFSLFLFIFFFLCLITWQAVLRPTR